ncbi:MAG TPA: hypothetical protein VMW58_10245, partial [Anaerolineae bacterium]|nr:hypothetical protein [Anaerolineae bacterium]
VIVPKASPFLLQARPSACSMEIYSFRSSARSSATVICIDWHLPWFKWILRIGYLASTKNRLSVGCLAGSRTFSCCPLQHTGGEIITASPLAHLQS